VEKAGWENPLNRKQGFGLYVRIRKNNTNDKYYFGHLSELRVKSGQNVVIGDIIGIEGSTGNSTGSHCHYCARGNGSKKEIRDICAISGIPNELDTFDDGYLAKLQAAAKSVEELANEVLSGKWGNGEERRQKLTAAGYDYKAVQLRVNEKVSGNFVSVSNEQIAREVIAGKWGNGEERRQKLTAAGYNPTIIQQIVNQILGG
jgi:hypothetical protein